ncbi:MAG: tRNA pseudouridine(38-40) synthase TruA [Gammaproteobacteria bacterium]
MIQRLALGIEYQGTNYYGWQSQPKQRTIQATIEQALSCIADNPISIIASGRTDAGVHAMGQVVHFDTAVSREIPVWVRGANHFLPQDIRVRWACSVPSDFHARYSALSRTYCYYIYQSKVASALLNNAVAWYPQSLDINLMQIAAQALIGEHDFSALRGRRCQAKSPIRTIKQLNITQQQNLIVIEITANAFLYHMVRKIVALLVGVASKKFPDNYVIQTLQSKNPEFCSEMAPASGLYLMQVDYPADYDLPHFEAVPWPVRLN